MCDFYIYLNSYKIIQILCLLTEKDHQISVFIYASVLDLPYWGYDEIFYLMIGDVV